MHQVLNFLRQIKENNYKEWFDAHKDEYLTATRIFNDFVTQLIQGVASFDASVRGLTVKDCTYRFYRDVRFSPNKEPYKSHFGAYIAPYGKKSGYAGYYFHIEPAGNGFLNGSQLDAGLYCPQPAVLKSVREEISLNGDRFLTAVGKSKDMELDYSAALKKVPRGFSSESPYAEYLKLKNFILGKEVNEQFLLDKNLLQSTLEIFRTSAPFVNWLNKAVAYAFENE